MKVRAIELRDANAFIAQHHRHHKPVQGHRFSLGLWDDDGTLHGVVCVGRPVARKVDQSRVLEVTRLCTDGTANACSRLYSAAVRAGTALGYERIQTYTLPQEGGSSLLASNWECDGLFGGGQWKHTDGKERCTTQPTDRKHRWSRILNPKSRP